MRRSLPILLASSAAALASCALDVQTIRYPEAQAIAARPPDCEVKLIDWYKPPDPSCRDVGDVFVGDSGFSFPCGRERVEERVRVEACRVGADLALVRHVRDLSSICDQVRARLLACPAPGPSEQP